MMTIVSRVRIKEGDEPAWDDVFRERASAAREQPAAVGQLVTFEQRIAELAQEGGHAD